MHYFYRKIVCCSSSSFDT